MPNISQIVCLIMLWGIYYAIIRYNFMLYSNTLIVNEMFDEIMDLTFVVDLNGKIVRVNKQVHALLGYELPELINTNISDILAAKEIEEIFGRKSLIHKTVKLNDIKVTTNYGGKIPLNLSISPIVNSKNHILLGILIVGQDISLIDNLKQVITIHEITAEKLRRSEELFRTVAETTPFAIIFTKRDDNTIFYVNKHAEELYQVSREDFVGTMAIQRYQNPEIRKSLISDLNESKVVRDREVTFKRFDKSIFVGTVTMVPVHFQGEEVILSCVADITEQKILLGHIVKSEEMLRKLMDAIPDLVVVTDVSGKISYTNKSLYPMLGYDTGKGEQPSNIFELVLEEDVERVRENFTRILQEDIMPIEYKYKKKDGTCIDAEVNGTVAKDETNEPFGFVFVVRDITERKKVQETLRRSKEEIELMNYELRKRNDLLHEKSIRDGLTNLYNHQHIIELLETEIHKSEINQNNLFIMMLDIDYFKTINDQFGHQTGDRVLNTVSKLIQVNIRDTDYAGRYGGEEFLIILPDIVRDDARQLADNIRLSIENFRFQQKELKITISIGLTGTRINRVKVLIDRADRLLYQAKSKGRNQIVTDWDIEKL
ncbi:hypothetical protein acsn021_34210 [Anaerocolumna cellulosilytica]|uniref:Diguanylate cyclase n=2 Tax=Anaerocolumna cellulosilytica TaxID=433286 RepID=A0A6S6R9B3_9FIRM|nr:hypothetical protein acsn021_34210 [Anaerocolumna cellulosilytica]